MIKVTSKYHFFWRDKSPFSNWFKEAPFNEPSESHILQFNCMEQYMMYHKALLFGDITVARQILAAKHPSQQKALGREVKNFDEDAWVENRERIVYKGLKLKFEQNYHILNQLEETKGLELVEASPYDLIWGIGMEKGDEGIEYKNNWKGLNLLGVLLTKLRVDIFGI